MAEFRAFLAWVTGKESMGEAGRELPGLARRLVRATTADEAAAWLKELNDRHGRHDDHLKEHTVAKQDPMHARGRKWWRTHERLRRAYFRLVRPNRAGVLFAFCDPAVLKGGGPLPSTTNQLEGGVNAVAKRALDHHRGSSEEHMRRCREWAVYMLAERPGPMALVTPEHWRTRKGKAGRERRAHARHHDGRAGTDRRRRRLRERVRDQKGMGRAINLTMTRGNRHTFLYLTPICPPSTGRPCSPCSMASR